MLTAPGPMQARRIEVIDAGDRFFAKHGPKAVFIGRWIALVRFAVAWLAGIDRMPFREFFVYNALGAITWATAYGLVGFYAGKAAADAITKYGVYAAIALVVLIVAFVVWRVVRARRGSRRLPRRRRRERRRGPPSGGRRGPPCGWRRGPRWRCRRR